MQLTWHCGYTTNQLIIIFLFLFIICRSACQTRKATKSVVITAEDEKLLDPEGYMAIMQLHHQMDDDNSGSIDRFESNDFIKEDMQFGGIDRAKREKAFHHNNDDQITVDDLWEAWFASDERSWNTVELVQWIENTVKLPQYASNFIEQQVDGRALPRMAVANSSFLATNLGIKNPVHRHKIHLKALDVVLFGFSGNGTSYMKDIALSVLLIVLVTVLIILKRQRSRSSTQLEQLTSKLSQLRSMESDFEDVQQRFEEERKKRLSVSDAIAVENEQMETLRSQLLEAERLLESSNSAPLALQPLLRRTCELELSYVGQQRLECIAEMREAIELIDKLRKKQSSIVSSIKLATGASTGTDQIDSRIFSLKARMEKISVAMEECQQRWIEIESLCGFPLMVQANGTELTFPGVPSSGVHIPRVPSATSSFCRSSGASSSGSGSTSSGNSTVVNASSGSKATLVRNSTHGIARSLPSSTPHYSQQHAGLSGTIHNHSTHLYSSSEDLRLRSLATLQRQHDQHHHTSPTANECDPSVPPSDHSQKSIRTDTTPQVTSRQITARLSKSSIGSNNSCDSNEDEKENGTIRNISHISNEGNRKIKFTLFRRSKN